MVVSQGLGKHVSMPEDAQTHTCSQSTAQLPARTATLSSSRRRRPAAPISYIEARGGSADFPFIYADRSCVLHVLCSDEAFLQQSLKLDHLFCEKEQMCKCINVRPLLSRKPILLGNLGLSTINANPQNKTPKIPNLRERQNRPTVERSPLPKRL